MEHADAEQRRLRGEVSHLQALNETILHEAQRALDSEARTLAEVSTLDRSKEMEGEEGGVVSGELSVLAREHEEAVASFESMSTTVSPQRSVSTVHTFPSVELTVDGEDDDGDVEAGLLEEDKRVGEAAAADRGPPHPRPPSKETGAYGGLVHSRDVEFLLEPTGIERDFSLFSQCVEWGVWMCGCVVLLLLLITLYLTHFDFCVFVRAD
jgi:hypothetical protein